MGTNYYVPDDPTCDNPEHVVSLHIGKSSWGWVFGFAAVRDRGLTTWAAWKRFLTGRTITDEYGRVVPVDDFVQMVEDKQRSVGRPPDKPNLSRLDPSVRRDVEVWGPYSSPPDPEREWSDPEGYDFYVGEFS